MSLKTSCGRTVTCVAFSLAIFVATLVQASTHAKNVIYDWKARTVTLGDGTVLKFTTYSSYADLLPHHEALPNSLFSNGNGQPTTNSVQLSDILRFEATGIRPDDTGHYLETNFELVSIRIANIRFAISYPDSHSDLPYVNIVATKADGRLPIELKQISSDGILSAIEEVQKKFAADLEELPEQLLRQIRGTQLYLVALARELLGKSIDSGTHIALIQAHFEKLDQIADSITSAEGNIKRRKWWGGQRSETEIARELGTKYEAAQNSFIALKLSLAELAPEFGLTSQDFKRACALYANDPSGFIDAKPGIALWFLQQHGHELIDASGRLFYERLLPSARIRLDMTSPAKHIAPKGDLPGINKLSFELTVEIDGTIQPELTRKVELKYPTKSGSLDPLATIEEWKSTFIGHFKRTLSDATFGAIMKNSDESKKTRIGVVPEDISQETLEGEMNKIYCESRLL